MGIGIAAATVALTIGVHLWRNNFILSVFLGTTVYTLAMSFLNAG